MKQQLQQFQGLLLLVVLGVGGVFALQPDLLRQAATIIGLRVPEPNVSDTDTADSVLLDMPDEKNDSTFSMRQEYAVIPHQAGSSPTVSSPAVSSPINSYSVDYTEQNEEIEGFPTESLVQPVNAYRTADNVDLSGIANYEDLNNFDYEISSQTLIEANNNSGIPDNNSWIPDADSYSYVEQTESYPPEQTKFLGDFSSNQVGVPAEPNFNTENLMGSGEGFPVLPPSDLNLTALSGTTPDYAGNGTNLASGAETFPHQNEQSNAATQENTFGVGTNSAHLGNVPNHVNAQNPANVQNPANAQVSASTQNPANTQPGAVSSPIHGSSNLLPDQRLHLDARIAEVVPCVGAETIARIGTDVILACDVLPSIKKRIYLDIIPPEERAKMTDEEYQLTQDAYVSQLFPSYLNDQILTGVIYYDFKQGRKKEEIELSERKMGDMFDANTLPSLMKKFKVESRYALNKELEKLGSSIERERQQAIQQNIAAQWMRASIIESQGECTHDEMFEYYNTHLYEFEHKARVKWRQLSASFANSGSREEAYNKIVWIGNQLFGGVPFEKLAQEHSDGPTAKENGNWAWTSKGVLVSSELENAIFQIKVGAVSRIIEDKTGFHIIQVMEREEDRHTPYLDAQSDIRKKIKNLRAQKKQTEFITELYQKYKPETYQNSINRLQRQEPQLVMPQDPGQSLHYR